MRRVNPCRRPVAQESHDFPSCFTELRMTEVSVVRYQYSFVIPEVHIECFARGEAPWNTIELTQAEMRQVHRRHYSACCATEVRRHLGDEAFHIIDIWIVLSKCIDMWLQQTAQFILLGVRQHIILTGLIYHDFSPLLVKSL